VCQRQIRELPYRLKQILLKRGESERRPVVSVARSTNMDSKILLRHSCGLSFEINSHAILNDVKGEWRVLVAKGEGVISTSIGRDTFWLIATWLMDHQIPIYLHTSLESIRYFITELDRFPHVVYISSLNVELQNKLVSLGQAPCRLTIPSSPATPLATRTNLSPAAGIYRPTEKKHSEAPTTPFSDRPPPHGGVASSQGIAFGGLGQGATFGTPSASQPNRHPTPRFGNPGIPLAVQGSPRVASFLGRSPGAGHPISSRAKKRQRPETGFFTHGLSSNNQLSGAGAMQPQTSTGSFHASSSSFSSPSSFGIKPASVLPSATLSSPLVQSVGASPSSLALTTQAFAPSPAAKTGVVLDGVSFAPASAPGRNDMDCSND